MRKLIFVLLMTLALQLHAGISNLEFKLGLYAPSIKSDDCEETSLTLEKEKEMLIFGNHRFAELDKEEVKFEGATTDEKNRVCDLYWKSISENNNKVSIIQTVKCPSGSKYDSTDKTIQSLTQIKDKLVYEASLAKNGEVVATSKCEFEFKRKIKRKKN